MKRWNFNQPLTRLAQWLTVVFIVGAVYSCRSYPDITEDMFIHDTCYISRVLHDSVYSHDSIYVKEYLQGDTVHVEKTKYCTMFKERVVHDTCYVAKHDTVRVTVKPEADAPGTGARKSWIMKFVDSVAMFAMWLIVLMAVARLFQWWAKK